jgi:hypothetical protein
MRSKVRRIFRYEIMWEREESLHEEIGKAWETAGQVQTLGDVSRALAKVKTSLKQWSLDKFGSVTKELKKLHDRMEELSRCGNADQEEFDKLRCRMEEGLYREEMMWLKWSRITWLKEGDMNTKFFHMKAAGWAKKNKITRLRKDNRQLTQVKEEMEGMACSFFQDLYRADPTVQPDKLLQIMQTQITPEMNEALCKDFSAKEISDALF